MKTILKAFGKVTLREQGASNLTKAEKKNSSRNSKEQSEKTNKHDKKRSFSNSVTRCYNCGMRDHISADCPTKEQGARFWM